MTRKERIIVGLDIGTTKTCAVVGEMTDSGIDIIGIGTHPSKGLRKGVVVNIDSTVDSIKRAVEEAEIMSGYEIKSVYTGIAGGHIRGLNSHGIVPVKGGEVEQGDVRRALEAATAIAIPLDRKIIHVLPQYYIVDDQDGIKEPIGMSGVRLEAKVHVVIGAVTSLDNIVKSINRVGLDVNDIMLEQLASGNAVLSQDEKELGVAVIDVGGGTTDIAVYAEGSVKHTAVLSLGGDYITNDIAVGLRTPAIEAEKIKIKYGCAYIPLITQNEIIEVSSVGGRGPRTVSRQVLGEIIEPRVEEILGLAHRELVKSGYEDILAAGVVLTGGSANLAGITELGEQIFNIPVRVGKPAGIGGITDIVGNSIYATAVGLVLHGSNSHYKSVIKSSGKGFMNRAMTRAKKWFDDFF